MITFIKKQPDMQNIAAGGTAVSVLTSGGKHHSIRLAVFDAGAAPTFAQLAAQIGNLIVKVNGIERIRIRAVDLISLSNFYGTMYGHSSALINSEIAAGSLCLPLYIPLTPLDMQSAAERSAWAWGTNNVQITVEAEIIAVTNIVRIQVYSEIEPVEAVLGQHIGITTITRTFGSASTEENIVDLPKNDNTAYKALHLGYGAANGSQIVSLTAMYNGAAIHDAVPLEVNNAILRQNGRTPQVNANAECVYHLDFGKDRNVSAYLPVSQNMQEFSVKPTWNATAPTAYRIIAEKVFGLPKV